MNIKKFIPTEWQQHTCRMGGGVEVERVNMDI